jgi:hypothetical protein
MLKTAPHEVSQEFIDIVNSIDTGEETFFAVEGFLEQNGLLDEFNQLLDIDIQHNWLNILTPHDSINNEFRWHNEKGDGEGKFHPGDYVGIIWIQGDIDCGGDLQVINEKGEIVKYDFKPNTLITMDANMFHRVLHYSGHAPRMSLNFTF